MKSYQFNTIEDFELAFEDLDLLIDISKETVDGIVRAIKEGKRVADLYTVDIASDEYIYTLKLPKSEWQSALKSCMSHFEKADRVDDVIDTFQVLKQLK